MKKLLLPLLLAAVMVTASCGKGNDGDKPMSSPEESPAASVSVSASPAATEVADGDTAGTGTDNESQTTADAGGTNLERMSPEDVADEEIDDGRTKNAFIGQWRAVGTTSENAAFTALELTITKDDYLVTMSFDNYAGTTSYKGQYELKNGILEFDESFIDCIAYFYESDIKTLVIDNGTSLVFCEHLEQESEMR